MNRGFTLIELVVAILVILLLVSAVLSNYNNFNENQKVKQAALTLKSDLRLGQTKALSAQKPTSIICDSLVGYEIVFSTVGAVSSYDIRAVCSNAGVTERAGDSEALTIRLPGGVTFSPLPNPASIIFRVLAKGISFPTEVTITLSGLAKGYQLQVSPNGDIKDLGFCVNFPC